MAAIPASYHAPALHYRARELPLSMTLYPFQTGIFRSYIHFTQQVLDCGYGKIKIELRKRLLVHRLLNLL